VVEEALPSGPLTGEAFGAPGLPARWTHGDKDGVGTAYSADSRLWYTVWRGIVTEVYFPTIDVPQTRDLQFLVTDGETFFHEERRHLVPTVERLGAHSLGFRVRSQDPEGRYAIEKEVISAPHLPAVLERVRLRTSPAWRSRLHVYALCAPHLEGGGAGNTARVVEVSGRRILVAEKGASALALGASVPFRRLSCGFVGRSDGWTDLSENLAMDWEFDSARNGNVALTGELDLAPGAEFTLALGLGRGLPHATTTLFQALASPYRSLRRRFLEQWARACRKLAPLGRHSGDGGRLLHASYSVLLGHEDKNYAGAFIASLSIPWGYVRGDEDRGGYHLVWTRDLVHIATGLLAAGNREAALRALVYLATRQQANGGFPQNFWVPGTPYWTGVQLDEVSHPILLAWRLARERALAEFDPYPMVLAAAGFLVREGPVSPQDRWEELAGYSPSTLAVSIAALVAASELARHRNDDGTATFLEEYADFLEAHLEPWTVTTEGTLDPQVPRHYVRVRPAAPEFAPPSPGANDGTLELPNQPPEAPDSYPAKEIVDGGFLELVRYGLRKADDPVVVASVRLVDRMLRTETPYGPCWRRYNHDGYGQRPDGGPFDGWGQGRAWPLLTGERGHYELAAGRDPKPYLAALERFASNAGFLPEQVWDETDRPDRHLALGRSTGSAVPLAWAHGEYLCLLRSVAEGRPYERIPELHRRYVERHARRPPVQVWKMNHRTSQVPAGSILRVIAAEPFRLRSSQDDWRTAEESASAPTRLGVDFLDVPVVDRPGATVRFTFYWPGREAWEGRDFGVEVLAGDGSGP
jgi:glucoamylase